MGWTHMSGWKTKEDALEGDLGSLKVVDKHIKGNIGYAAVEANNGKVFGLVALFRKDDDEIWIKLMPEDMGPYEYACPKRILNRLTPVDELFEEHSRERAQGWREGCLAYHNRPKPKRLKPGMKVRFERVLDFGPFEEQEFEVERIDKQTVFRAGNGKVCHIKGYTNLNYTVIE